MNPPARAVVFDLDGTLVDSAVSIAAVLDRMRRARGLAAPLALGDVRSWVSLGAESLVSTALAEARRSAEGDLDEFRKAYAAEQTAPECVYAGMREALLQLATLGMRLAVCSNKPQSLCLKVLRDTRMLAHFSAVLGGDSVPRAKPDPAHLLAAVAALDSEPATSVYVGDSSIDLLASRAAGVRFLFARYGYADPCLARMDLSQIEAFDSPHELPALLGRRPGSG